MSLPSRLLVVCGLSLGWSLGLAAHSQEPAPPEPASAAAEAPVNTPSVGAMRTLVRQLGDDSFAMREAATRRLSELGPSAKAVLMEGMKDQDMEVRTRSRQLWQRIGPYSGFAWSKLAPATTLEKELGRIVEQSAGSLASDSVFTARGYTKIRDNHALAAAWLHVLNDFDDHSRLEGEAAAVRDALMRTPLKLNSRVQPDTSLYLQAKGAQDALAKLLQGEKSGAPLGKPQRPLWGEVTSFTSIMRRMEIAQDRRIRVWTVNAEELDRNAKEIVHEAQLVAVLCQIILDKSYDCAEEASYQGWAKRLQMDCVDLVAATKRKDAEGAKQLAGDIFKQCSACHQDFR